MTSSDVRYFIESPFLMQSLGKKKKNSKSSVAVKNINLEIMIKLTKMIKGYYQV
jgi:hypothetical protein